MTIKIVRNAFICDIVELHIWTKELQCALQYYVNHTTVISTQHGTAFHQMFTHQSAHFFLYATIPVISHRLTNDKAYGTVNNSSIMRRIPNSGIFQVKLS